MKKLLFILAVFVLSNIQIKLAISNSNLKKAASHSSTKKISALNFPEQTDFLHMPFKKIDIFKSINPHSNNDKRLLLYANRYDNARILIVNEIVANEREAMKLFLQQAKARDNPNPHIKSFGNVQYIEGTDSKIDGRYVITLEYNKVNKRMIIRSLMYQKKAQQRDFYLLANSIKEDQLVNELLNFAKNKK